MSKITTIYIHPGLHKAAVEISKTNAIKGGFSGYVELLIKENLKKNGIDWKKLHDESLDSENLK
jgi:hypothetical protein